MYVTCMKLPVLDVFIWIETQVCEPNQDSLATSGNHLFVPLCSVLPFMAFVIVYWGHSLFHFTTFSFGLSCGTIISFFFLSKQGASAVDDKFVISLLIGIIYGMIWVGIWYNCGIPILSASLTFLHSGVLIACICYHFGLADLEPFHRNGFYWSIFFGIIVACWLILSIFTMPGHIFSCAFFGSYVLMVTTLNFWMGGNLQYVVINVYRRICVPNFNDVILDPPFQPRDFFVALLGIFFVAHGFYKQLKNQAGRPPFPPHISHRYGVETTPLLGAY
ncbi:hypothetical protein HHI36_009939 [Cryptolaemus montrouzieri]|uniref:TM7S3/TM198-like domain-containing protein n=1 Tax=Cryptolaemus montrouzieri TaxID=559131 RepID=A0ABD2MHP2_9CUCU